MSFRLVQKSVTSDDLEWRNGQTTAKICRFFDFLRWQPPSSWIFKFWKFNAGKLNMAKLRQCAPNFVEFGQTASEIW